MKSSKSGVVLFVFAVFALSSGCGPEGAGTVPVPVKGDPGPAGVPGVPGVPGLPGMSGVDGKNYEAVTPTALKGWQFATINTARTAIKTGAVYAWPYTYGDENAGSAVLETGAGDGAGLGGKPYLGYSGLNYLPLNRLDGLVWHTYVPGPSANLTATGSGYWNIYVYLGTPAEIPANPANYDNLVVDKAYFPDASYQPTTDVWQSWSVDGTTKVRCRYQKLKVGPNPTDLCVKDAPYPLAVFRQYNPGAFILPAWCAEIPYALPGGAACNPASSVVNSAAPGITFQTGQSSGGIWKNFTAYANGLELISDGYSARFVFRGK